MSKSQKVITVYVVDENKGKPEIRSCKAKLEEGFTEVDTDSRGTLEFQTTPRKESEAFLGNSWKTWWHFYDLEDRGISAISEEDAWRLYFEKLEKGIKSAERKLKMLHKKKLLALEAHHS